MAILEVSMNYLGSRRRPADPGWVNERSEWHQKGRALNLMLSSEAAFRRRREQGSETPSCLI